MKKKQSKFKYRFFRTFNGETIEAFGNDLAEANNNSYHAGMPYYKITSSGKMTKVVPTYIMNNFIDDGFHNRIVRKNPTL